MSPTVSKPKTRKDRERVARREEILAAAARIFAQKGFEATTLDEIAEKAEFGKGTLYLYFESKEHLFFSILDEGVQAFHQFVEQKLNEIVDPIQKLQRYIQASFEFVQGHEDFLKLYLFEMFQPNVLEPRYREKLKRTFRDKLRVLEEILKPVIDINSVDFDPHQTALALKWLIQGQYYFALTSSNHDYPRASDFVTRLFFDGIGGKRGKV
jgi:AcrR family transcriptional regulator